MQKNINLINEETSKRCFIAGCGPSLLNFNQEKYKDIPIISLNGSFEVIKAPKYHIAFDRRFVKNYPDFYKQSSTIKRFAAIKLLKLIHSKLHNEIFFYYYRHNKIDIYKNSFSLKNNLLDFLYSPSILCFGLQLAIWIGFREIFLLGIDFDYNLGRCCQKHDPAHGRLEMTLKWLQNYDVILKDNNIRVFNSTHDSKLKLFPFMFFD